MATPKPKILLSGMISGVPRQGGATWAVLQYLLGFERLGCEIHFIEPVEEAALRPVGVPLLRSDNAAYFRRVMADFGMSQTSALLLAGTQQTVGVSYERLRELARRVDVLVNISGLLTDEALTEDIPLRAYLDLDPAFTQLWQAAEGIDMRFAAHNRFVTIGQAIGAPGCVVPTCGLEWVTTPQPIVLERWTPGRITTHNALTTVANWRGYGSIEHEGVFYGQKVHSWRQFFSLPVLSGERFAPALAIHPEERGPGGLARQRLALDRPGACDPDARRLPALRSWFQGRVRHRQERLRHLPLRLVQRPECLLPGVGPSGHSPGDRF